MKCNLGRAQCEPTQTIRFDSLSSEQRDELRRYFRESAMARITSAFVIGPDPDPLIEYDTMQAQDGEQ